VDSFARGVRFNFASEGFIRRFDWFTAINYFITLVLLIMSVVPAMLKFAAFHWPGDLKAPVYEAATNEKFSYRGALATFSAQSAMAKEFASTFEADTGGRINRANFEAQLRKHFPPFSAAALTESIFAAVDAANQSKTTDTTITATITEEFVTKEDVMQIFTSHVFDMQALLKSSFRKLDEFPPGGTMNVEELRAIAALEKVTVGTDDNLDIEPSRLSVKDVERAKAAYTNALRTVLSKLNSTKDLPSSLERNPTPSAPSRTSLDMSPPVNTPPPQTSVKIRVPQGAMVSLLAAHEEHNISFPFFIERIPNTTVMRFYSLLFVTNLT
jgi:hypothetical protein